MVALLQRHRPLLADRGPLYTAVINAKTTTNSNNIVQLTIHKLNNDFKLQWNPSKTDTVGTNDFVRCSKGVLSSGVNG